MNDMIHLLVLCFALVVVVCSMPGDTLALGDDEDDSFNVSRTHFGDDDDDDDVNITRRGLRGDDDDHGMHTPRHFGCSLHQLSGPETVCPVMIPLVGYLPPFHWVYVKAVCPGDDDDQGMHDLKYTQLPLR